MSNDKFINQLLKYLRVIFNHDQTMGIIFNLYIINTNKNI